MPTLVARFTLAAYCQDEDHIESGHEAIQHDIAARLPPDHQFALPTLDRPTDERRMRQNLYRLHDLFDPLGRLCDFESGHVVQETIKIIKDFRREFDSSHE